MNYAPEEAQRSLGERVCSYLVGQMDDQGRVYDAVDRAAVQSGQYAQTFLAWACLNIDNPSAAAKALKAFFMDIENTWPHADFNTFALAHVLTHRNSDSLPGSIQDQVNEYLRQPPFRSEPGSHISNNWLAMHAAALAILGSSLDKAEWTARARELVHDFALKWQMPDGLFVDFPMKPRFKQGGFALPLTYHTKICAMLLLYGLTCRDDTAYRAAEIGMDALGSLVFTSGDAFQFGRTNMGLFGYACAIYALSMLMGASSIRDPIHWAYIHRRLVSRLGEMSHPEGYIDLNPAGSGDQRPGWDEYMHLSVYNAFFAALATVGSDGAGKRFSLPERNADALSLLADSGLARIRSGNSEVLVSLAGTHTFGHGHLFCDNRYAGFNICHLVTGNHTVVSPPAFSCEQGVDPFDGSLLAFHPRFDVGKRRYQFKFFTEVEHLVLDNSRRLLAWGNSRPIEIRVIDWPNQPVLTRAFWKAMRQVLGRQHPDISHKYMRGSSLRRVMLVDRKPFFVLFIDRIRFPHGAHEACPVGVSCPAGRWRTDSRGIVFTEESGTQWRYLFTPIPTANAQTSQTLTSTGTHDIVCFPDGRPEPLHWQVCMLVQDQDKPVDIDLHVVGDDFLVTIKWSDSQTMIEGTMSRSIHAGVV